MRQAALVKGLSRMNFSSADMFKGGAIRAGRFAPRGSGYYDAFTQPVNNAVLANSVGPVTPIAGHARLPIPGDVGFIDIAPTNAAGDPATYPLNSNPALTAPMPATNSRMIVFNCGSSDSHVGFLMYPTVEGVVHVESLVCSAFNGLATPLVAPLTSTSLGGDTNIHSSLAQDVESIPLRGSIRLLNTTEERFQGGVVRTLRYNGGLLFGHDGDPADYSGNVFPGPTVDSYFRLRDMIRDSARTHHHSGRDFASAQQFNLHPADFIRSNTFSATHTLYNACITPKFNTLLILIDDFTASGTHTNNSYEVNCQVQRAGRFAPGTLHHNNGKEMRHDAELLARVTALENKNGSAPAPPAG
jgi:hypothetical protein